MNQLVLSVPICQICKQALITDLTECQYCNKVFHIDCVKGLKQNCKLVQCPICLEKLNQWEIIHYKIDAQQKVNCVQEYQNKKINLQILQWQLEKNQTTLDQQQQQELIAEEQINFLQQTINNIESQYDTQQKEIQHKESTLQNMIQKERSIHNQWILKEQIFNKLKESKEQQTKFTKYSQLINEIKLQVNQITDVDNKEIKNEQQDFNLILQKELLDKQIIENIQAEINYQKLHNKLMDYKISTSKQK